MKADKNTLEKYEKTTAPSLPSARSHIRRSSLLIVSADASTRLLLRLELLVDFASVVPCLFTAQEVHENVSEIQEKRVWHRNTTITLWTHTRPKSSTAIFSLSHSFQGGGYQGERGQQNGHIYSLTSSRTRQKEKHSLIPQEVLTFSRVFPRCLRRAIWGARPF